MKTRLLEGKKIADQIKAEVAQVLEVLRKRGLVPTLAAVLVGKNPASCLYVRNKTRACHQLGIRSEQIKLGEETTTEELIEVIGRLNRNQEVDGILVQLPLPEQVDEEKVLETIHPDKDVDGFHPINVGKLCVGKTSLAPCTPSGILEMLKREGIRLVGAQAVVVGRSDIVGKPMALLLLHEHCTVTICHSQTRDLPAVCSQADILVAAIGRPAFFSREFIREGTVVVDVGINRIETREEVTRLFGEDSIKMAHLEKRGSVLVGDVHPRDPLGVAAAITPVPGGVGPLTIAQLMKNTVLACRLRRPRHNTDTSLKAAP